MTLVRIGTVLRKPCWLAALMAVLAIRGPASAEPAAIINWRLEPRFGLDEDNDGLIDVANTEDYVRNAGLAGVSGPPRFRVTFDAGGSQYKGVIQSYVWSIRGPGVELDLTSPSPTFTPDDGLPEGVYEAALRIDGTNGPATARALVPVEDFLIACLGDSYASGEGNPDRPLLAGLSWADDGAGPVPGPSGQAHGAAHRSSLAWAAQAAMEIERADPRTSVTFVFFAESGATLRRSGPEQLASLAGIAAGRRVDALLLSFGGNDIGFVGILTELVRLSPVLAALPPIQILDIDLEFGYDYSEKLEDLWWLVDQEVDGLAASFHAFETERAALGLDVLNTWIIEYPEPGGAAVRGGVVERCDGILALSCELLAKAGELCKLADLPACRDLGFMLDANACPALEAAFSPLRLEEVFRIDAAEQQAAAERGLSRLNAAVHAGAAANGWSFVEGILTAFQDGHGECTNERWMRRLDESLLLQGHVHGALHPNERGHQAMKRALLAKLHLPADVPALGITDADDQIAEAQSLGTMGTDEVIEAQGSIEAGSDADVFAVTLSRPGTLRVVVAGSGGRAPALRIFNDAGQALAAPSADGAIEVAIAVGGTVHLGVSGPANVAWDPVTGSGDEAGGFVDGYELELRWRSSPSSRLFRRGEANSDGSIDLSDGIFILTYLFSGGRAPECLDAADADDSETLELTDAVRLLNFLFLGGPPPPTPSVAACGPDPAGEDLGCEQFSSCD